MFTEYIDRAVFIVQAHLIKALLKNNLRFFKLSHLVLLLHVVAFWPSTVLHDLCCDVCTDNTELFYHQTQLHIQ